MFSSFATAVGEPNNGVIYNCPIMTSSLETIEPPTDMSMQSCFKLALNICVKPIPGKCMKAFSLSKKTKQIYNSLLRLFNPSPGPSLVT